MVSLLKNKFYRINRWLDDHETSKFLIMILSIGIPNFLIVFSDRSSSGFILTGSFLFLFVCAFTVARISYTTGSLKFNYDLYKVPENGEALVITKDFVYGDVSFSNNDELLVYNVYREHGDFKISVCDSKKKSYEFKYFESRKYWKTKGDLRNKRLSKLGI